MASGYARYNGVLGGGGGASGGVTSLNGETGALTLVAGSGISITPVGTNITIENKGTLAPGGTSGQVQYNNSGVFGGFGSWDGTTLSITGNATFTGTLGASNLSGTNTGDLTLGTANGLSIASQVLSLGLSSASTTGALSSTDWTTFNSKGSGTITAVSVASANGFAGTSSGGATPALTLSTTITGILQGNGTAISAATTIGSGSVVLSAGPTITSLNAGSTQIINVTDPTTAQMAATKNYVDTVASGLNPAQAVTAATIGSNIAGTYVQVGGGIGDTFTTTSTATFTVDGVTPTIGQRILFKDQTSGQQNGIYNITTLANVGVLGAIFTRALDYDTVSDINAGDLIPVISGTINANTSWLQTATVTSVGSSGTPLVFAQWTANPANYLLKANNLSDVSTKATAFNNISPLTTGGDLLYGGASGAGTRLANGTANQYLASAGGTSPPSWTSFVAPTRQTFLTQPTRTGWLFTVNTANATVGATYTNNGNTYTVLGTISSGTQLFTSGANVTSGSTLTKASGTGDSTITFTASNALGTYTVPSSPRTPLYLKIKMVGGGGGGSGSGTASGSSATAGATSYFGANLLSGGGGGAGIWQGSGGAGGAASLGTGPSGLALSGGSGNGPNFNVIVNSNEPNGGSGGNSVFGGGGGGGGPAGVGLAGGANTGGGGGGGGAPNLANVWSGTGGGAGGSVDALIVPSAATYPILIGTGGIAGTAGSGANSQPGGAGGSGNIDVEEYYQ